MNRLLKGELKNSLMIVLGLLFSTFAYNAFHGKYQRFKHCLVYALIVFPLLFAYFITMSLIIGFLSGLSLGLCRGLFCSFSHKSNSYT